MEEGLRRRVAMRTVEGGGEALQGTRGLQSRGLGKAQEGYTCTAVPSLLMWDNEDAVSCHTVIPGLSQGACWVSLHHCRLLSLGDIKPI